MKDISSEEELLELRNTGKISEAEYQDLFEAMRKTSQSGNEEVAAGVDKTKSKRRLGKKAFVLMLLGIMLPFSCFFIIETLAPPNAGAAIAPWFFLGLALEIAALTMGIKSWSNAYGKAAAIASGIIIVLGVLMIAQH